MKVGDRIEFKDDFEMRGVIVEDQGNYWKVKPNSEDAPKPFYFVHKSKAFPA